jgi:predicted DNA-binding WGR domain protein
MIECDLFRTIRLVRNWGPVGSQGPEQVEIFPTETEAVQAGQKQTCCLRKYP